jgi:hypothetical protein
MSAVVKCSQQIGQCAQRFGESSDERQDAFRYGRGTKMRLNMVIPLS